MAITSAVTTLTLDSDNKVMLPLGSTHHKHVIWVKMGTAGGQATTAEVKWASDNDFDPALNQLFGFGDVLETNTGESIVHEGIAPRGGNLWLVTNGPCEEILHYCYDKRHLRVGD